MDSITFSLGDEIINPGGRNAWDNFRNKLHTFRPQQRSSDHVRAAAAPVSDAKQATGTPVRSTPATAASAPSAVLEAPGDPILRGEGASQPTQAPAAKRSLSMDDLLKESGREPDAPARAMRPEKQEDTSIAHAQATAQGIAAFGTEAAPATPRRFENLLGNGAEQSGNVWSHDRERGPIFAKFLTDVERTPEKGETENAVQAKATLTCAADMMLVGQRQHKADPFNVEKREAFRLDVVSFHAAEQAHAKVHKKRSLIAALGSRIETIDAHADEGRVAYAKTEGGPTERSELFKGRVLQTPLNASMKSGITDKQLQKRIADLDEQIKSGIVFTRNENGEDSQIAVIRARVPHVNKLPAKEIMTMLRDDMQDVLTARSAIKDGSGVYLSTRKDGVEHSGLAIRESDGRYSKEGVWHASQGTVVKEISVYENGVLNGDALTTHPNGMLKTKVPYNVGVKHGVASEYNLDGDPRVVHEYRNGRKAVKADKAKAVDRVRSR